MFMHENMHKNLREQFYKIIFLLIKLQNDLITKNKETKYNPSLHFIHVSTKNNLRLLASFREYWPIFM